MKPRTIHPVYCQKASKKYIEFLRDENRADNAGAELYTQWENAGMSPPVMMRQQSVFNLTPGVFGDADCSGTVDLADFGLLGDCVTGPNRRLNLGCEALDSETDGNVDLLDIAPIGDPSTGRRSKHQRRALGI